MNSIACLECANEIVLEEEREYKNGDIVECPHCGTELVILEIKEDGSYVLEIVEEEK
jgi:DNA-directed RNA polymerase subunit RPC12/RpoP